MGEHVINSATEVVDAKAQAVAALLLRHWPSAELVGS